MWEHYIHFAYKKFANALSPRGPKGKPELMFLKHFRTQSDGWNDSGNCDEFIDNRQVLMLPFHVRDLSLECECKMCTRHPPSLADSVRHVLFNYTLHLDRFHHEGNTPYDLYVYAARSNQVSQDALLPPEAQMIIIWYCNDINSPLKVHRDCLCAGPWINQSERKYDSYETLNNDLIIHKNHFWCHQCDKGLFFFNFLYGTCQYPRSC